VRLDHIALATRDAGPALDVLVGELGGTVLSGGLAVGYRPMQVHLGTATEGMKVELLEPWLAEQNDFLERFVTRHGEGPHHLTFKVDDLEATLARVEAAGITPVGVEMSVPIWKEAFIQPRDAHGTVVQLAESSSPEKTALEEYAAAATNGAQFMGEQWWPDPPHRAASVTLLRRIVMTSPNLPDALDFFVGLLDGTRHAQGEGWVELSWPGGGHLRLEQRADRTAGIDRLEADGAGPARELVVGGARLLVGAPG
jgi:methylmalonyl-CoA/ethylmalonyl-CoA epimerase